MLRVLKTAQARLHKTVIVGVRADPKPQQTGIDLDGEGAMTCTDAH